MGTGKSSEFRLDVCGALELSVGRTMQGLLACHHWEAAGLQQIAHEVFSHPSFNVWNFT